MAQYPKPAFFDAVPAKSFVDVFHSGKRREPESSATTWCAEIFSFPRKCFPGTTSPFTAQCNSRPYESSDSSEVVEDAVRPPKLRWVKSKDRNCWQISPNTVDLPNMADGKSVLKLPLPAWAAAPWWHPNHRALNAA